MTHFHLRRLVHKKKQQYLGVCWIPIGIQQSVELEGFFSILGHVSCTHIWQVRYTFSGKLAHLIHCSVIRLLNVSGALRKPHFHSLLE